MTKLLSDLEASSDLETLNREGLKHAEEELKILHEEPDDLIKNLETLISVRSAFENEAPRSASNVKSRNLKRRHDADNGVDSPAPTPDPSTAGSKATAKGTSRSGSVTASVKQEPVVDSTEGQINGFLAAWIEELIYLSQRMAIDTCSSKWALQYFTEIRIRRRKVRVSCAPSLPFLARGSKEGMYTQECSQSTPTDDSQIRDTRRRPRTR